MNVFCGRIGKHELAMLMYLMGVVQFGSFRLKAHRSGWPEMEESPFFINLRSQEDGGPLTLDAARFIGQQLGFWYQDTVSIVDPDSRFIVGIPRAGTPLAEGFQSVISCIRLVSMRKADGKESQIQACIDGEIPQGSLGIAIDDVATDGASKIEVATRIRECGCGFNIDRFVIMVDRGGVSELQEKGYDIRAMYNLGELMGIYLEKQIISPDQHAKILGYDAYMKQYKASHPQLVTAP